MQRSMVTRYVHFPKPIRWIRVSARPRSRYGADTLPNTLDSGVSQFQWSPAPFIQIPVRNRRRLRAMYIAANRRDPIVAMATTADVEGHVVTLQTFEKGDPLVACMYCNTSFRGPTGSSNAEPAYRAYRPKTGFSIRSIRRIGQKNPIRVSRIG